LSKSLVSEAAPIPVPLHPGRHQARRLPWLVYAARSAPGFDSGRRVDTWPASREPSSHRSFKATVSSCRFLGAHGIHGRCPIRAL